MKARLRVKISINRLKSDWAKVIDENRSIAPLSAVVQADEWLSEFYYLDGLVITAEDAREIFPGERIESAPNGLYISGRRIAEKV